MMWDVIPNKKGPIKMLTQKMQETITRFKKEPQSRHAHAGRSAAKIQKQSVKAACGNPHPLPPLPGRQLRL